MIPVMLGDCVLYRDRAEDGKKDSPDWPAHVYAIRDQALGIVGLTALKDGIPTRFARVGYSDEVKPETWRFP